MFQKLLEPYMAKTHPCTIQEYRSIAAPCGELNIGLRTACVVL